MFIDFNLIIQSLPALLRGSLLTLQIALCGGILGVSLGTLLALLQISQFKVVRWIVGFYVGIIRGTPMLIQVTIAFYVLPQLGLALPALWAAILAIGLNSAAYVSQTIRSGINAVGKGQIEAAYVLGFTHIQTLRYIVLPQAFKLVLPALGNEFITLVKDSSLASIIGVAELTREGSLIRSRTFDALSIYAAVALIYLLITTLLTFGVAYLEKRMNKHARH